MDNIRVITWTWYGCVAFVMVCRFVSRILHMGSIRNLQADDWLMWLAFTTYTIDIVFLNIVAVTPTNLFPPGTNVANFTPADYTLRIYGSKITVVVELCQCVTIWTVKACLLIMYLRLTTGRPERKYIKALACYVAGGFVLMEILYLGVWCRPIRNYWAVPTPNIQCSAATHHLITNAALNLSSDLLLLVIALPMFLRTQMMPRKKYAICAVFSLGFFNIIAAILNKYYSFTNPFGSEWTAWYCHESSTSMMVANLPFLYTLLRRVFNLSSLNGSDYYRPSGYAPGASRKSHTKADGETNLLSRGRHARRYGDGTVNGDTDFVTASKFQAVTITRNIEIEEEKIDVRPGKDAYELDFLSKAGGHTETTIVSTERAVSSHRSASSLSDRAMPQAPENAAMPDWHGTRGSPV